MKTQITLPRAESLVAGFILALFVVAVFLFNPAAKADSGHNLLPKRTTESPTGQAGDSCPPSPSPSTSPSE